jgi:hypothetical protein
VAGAEDWNIMNDHTSGPLELMIGALNLPCLSDNDLGLIAKRMSASEAARHNKPPRGSQLPPGITYLGQFITHDIVPSTNRTNARNNVSPFLNLDSVYWPDDQLSNYVHQQGELKGQFKQSADFGFDYPFAKYDIPRDSAGVPLIPELRNDENTIVSQLHAFWMRLHNALLTSGGVQSFDEAKALTVKYFQLCVLNDFLPAILHKSVFQLYFREHASVFAHWDKSAIPPFFSHAAFRFGHSMVRSDYLLNDEPGGGRTLNALFRYAQPLNAINRIDWPNFFCLTRFNLAMKIDSQITDLMNQVVFPPVSHKPINPVVLNLLAGKQAGLVSGYVYALLLNHSQNRLQATPITSLSGTGFAALELSNGKVLDAQQLPLWPYILLEAEQSADDQLGILGSVMVAEVVANAIQHCPTSIWHAEAQCYQDSDFGPISVGANPTDGELGSVQPISIFIDLLNFIQQSEKNNDAI